MLKARLITLPYRTGCRILFTTRNNLEATKWLIENKIDKYFKNVTNVKIPAYLYLDDRAIVNQMSLARLGLTNEDLRIRM